MKILLIKPAWFRNGVYEHCRLARVPPLNLGILAALSRKHDVTLIDEDVEYIPYSSQWDLVGITVATSTAIEAYHIADNFRRLHVKVVLGGVHASLMPQEALEHADAVIVGEGEEAWPNVLADFPQLKNIYSQETPTDLDQLPLPRRDLFHSSYVTAPVQLTRGCTHECSYCYLQSVPWKQYRKRDVHLVEEEFKHIHQKYVLVVDDNLFVDTAYVSEVAGRIRSRKKFWGVQAPLSLGEDSALLKQLSASGLCGVSLGIDSVLKESLEQVSKGQNDISRLKQIVTNFHRYGIGVCGFFVFGFEGETPEVFQLSQNIIQEANLDAGVYFVLTPYPGTEFYQSLEDQGRILTRDWSRYNWSNAVYKPSHMSAETLEMGTRQMYQAVRKRKLFQFYKMVPMTIRMLRRSPRLTMLMKDYLFLKPNGSEECQ